jgi:Zn-finger nucleic acid-binding protein
MFDRRLCFNYVFNLIHKTMNCPNCNVTLVMSDKQGIEIDYCPKCRGIWLDRGELDKIIERSAATQGKSDFNPHNDMHESHDYEQHGYDKGILEGFSIKCEI